MPIKNRKRNRMLGFDYSSDRLYFVTICVKDMVCCLVGAVGTGRDLSLDDIGDYGTGRDLSVQSPMQKVLILNPYGVIVENRIKWLVEQYEYVEVHNYVVMPNHIHLIIEIDSLKVKGKDIKIKSLSSLIGAFKTTSSKAIHESGLLSFAWKRSFHDHIIRTEHAYWRISNYIDLNPEKWMEDKFFKPI